ncbi:c-type cytochrome [Actibacterium mucosum]|nr:c-type cytochrome [Actibacterium mucosum]
MRALLMAGMILTPMAAMADGLNGFVTRDRLPEPPLPVLVQGALVWEGTCQNCHGGNKLTGAPKVTSEKDWAPRIAKGINTLNTHAIDGFIGPKYTQMPAKGGNPDLSDDDVRAAVAFMVWVSGGQDAALAWAQETQTNSETE